MSEAITIVELGDDGVSTVQWVLYTALAWNDDPNIPDIEAAMAHPEVGLYHVGWGRRGDVALAATLDGELVGAAFARLFMEEAHGYGFVDEETPELGVGVARKHRGQGIGRLLICSLADLARREGHSRLSLSVNNPNPAKHLYEARGYLTFSNDGSSSVMVLEL